MDISELVLIVNSVLIKFGAKVQRTMAGCTRANFMAACGLQLRWELRRHMWSDIVQLLGLCGLLGFGVSVFVLLRMCMTVFFGPIFEFTASR